MNNDSQFEKRLRDQAIKAVPTEWRADILQEAARAIEDRGATLATPVTWFEMFQSRFAALLWPAPRAWAALAAVWVIILMMNLSGGQESKAAAQIPVAQARLALKQKQLLMAELAGRTPEAVQPRTTSPGPRSHRCEGTSAV